MMVVVMVMMEDARHKCDITPATAKIQINVKYTGEVYALISCKAPWLLCIHCQNKNRPKASFYPGWTTTVPNPFTFVTGPGATFLCGDRLLNYLGRLDTCHRTQQYHLYTYCSPPQLCLHPKSFECAEFSQKTDAAQATGCGIATSRALNIEV